jgi:hypothetical protein
MTLPDTIGDSAHQFYVPPANMDVISQEEGPFTQSRCPKCWLIGTKIHRNASVR